MTPLHLMTWRVGDVHATAAEMTSLGFRVGAPSRRERPAVGVALGNAALEIRSLATAHSGRRGVAPAGERLDVADRLFDDRAAAPSAAAGLQGAHPNGVVEVAAVGWATVDGERTAERLGVSWAPSARDDLLGASACVVRTTGVSLVVLEPDTEGRLVAALARRGEGPAALYLRAAGPPAGAPSGASALGAARLWQPTGRGGLMFLVVTTTSD